MNILFLNLILPTYLIIKIILYLFTKKYGKINYNGFDAVGFKYNKEKDIFVSTKNAWQRNFGYSKIYDTLAPLGQMIIDTEWIRFYYNNKNYLIAFWKGQYGITTGGEIGTYYTNELKIKKNTLYMPLEDNDILPLSFTLYKNKEELTSVEERHWWLAIFKLGMFSQPRELTMDIKITFPSIEMLNSFLKSFKKLHHSKKNYQVVDTTFYYKYKRPHMKKAFTRGLISDLIRQHYNKKNVYLYQKYLSNIVTNNSDDKMIDVNNYIPDILKNNPQVINLINPKNVYITRNDVYSKFSKKNE